MKLNIFRSLAEALRFSVRYAVPFYLLGLMVGLPSYLRSFLPQETQRLTLPGGQFHTEILPRPWWETDLALPAIEAVLLGVMVAIMVHTRRRDRRGGAASLRASLADMAPSLPTVIVVSLIIRLAETLIAAGGDFAGSLVDGLSVLGLVLSFALLTAFQVVFCVAIPCAADNGGVIGSFRRSAALTAGSRGELLGLFVILSLPFIAAGAALPLLIQNDVFSGGIPELGIWLISAAFGAYLSALTVVLHEALVALKEGAGAGTLATVFD